MSHLVYCIADCRYSECSGAVSHIFKSEPEESFFIHFFYDRTVIGISGLDIYFMSNGIYAKTKKTPKIFRVFSHYFLTDYMGAKTLGIMTFIIMTLSKTIRK